MAEEKKQPEEKKQSRKEEAPEQQEEGKKKSKIKMILFLALIVIFLGGGGAGFYFFSGKIMSNKIIQKYFGKKPPEGEQQEEGEQKETKEHKKKELVGPILALDPFVFNMSGNQAKYAKVTLGIELKDAKVLEETKKMVPVIRDKILSIFGAKAPEALMDVGQRSAIKTEVQASLKTLFKDEEELRAVYITDIIIQ